MASRSLNIVLFGPGLGNCEHLRFTPYCLSSEIGTGERSSRCLAFLRKWNVEVFVDVRIKDLRSWYQLELSLKPVSSSEKQWRRGRDSFLLFGQVLVIPTDSDSSQCLCWFQAHSEFKLRFPQFT